MSSPLRRRCKSLSFQAMPDRQAYSALFLVLAFFVAATFWYWAPLNFVNEASPVMGESNVAYLGAQNLDLFGWKWAGLQDTATTTDPKDHPALYIHHANFGMYFSYALRKLGYIDFGLQNAISIVGSILGLLLSYLVITRVSESR